MKSYNDLWDKYLDQDNIVMSVHGAACGSKNKELKRLARELPYDAEVLRQPKAKALIQQIREYAADFNPPGHRPVEIYDGLSRKKRIIIVPKAWEQIVHHMVVNVMREIYLKGAYEHCFTIGSWRDNRKTGAQHGKKVVESWIKGDPEGTRYCLKMDIEKFFQNVPHELLFLRHKRIIKDKKFLEVIRRVIYTVDEKYGQPLGFYTSQWTTDWYLQPLDHFIKEDLGVKYYGRFRDDMVVFAEGPGQLHWVRDKVVEYLEGMGLQLNHKWQVFPLAKERRDRQGRPLDFMGFKFYQKSVNLRKSILRRGRQAAMNIWKKDKATVHDCRRFMSYLGWIDHSDTYGFYYREIRPFVEIRRLKKRISKYDKRMSKIMKKLIEELTKEDKLWLIY